MIEHFDSHLNIRKLILDKRPKVIVECGAGDGETTRMLAFMKHYYPFKLHVISDKEIDRCPSSVTFHTRISYDALNDFANGSIDLCFVDTDHNYWTLAKELLILKEKMAEGGLVVMHDVEAFYYDTGMALAYWNNAPYPKEEIMAQAKMGGLGLCLIDFLHTFRGFFKLVRYIPESNGMAVIERVPEVKAKIITPGTQPLYAPPVPTASNG